MLTGLFKGAELKKNVKPFLADYMGWQKSRLEREELPIEPHPPHPPPSPQYVPLVMSYKLQNYIFPMVIIKKNKVGGGHNKG